MTVEKSNIKQEIMTLCIQISQLDMVKNQKIKQVLDLYKQMGVSDSVLELIGQVEASSGSAPAN